MEILNIDAVALGGSVEFQVCSDVHLEENPEKTFADVIDPLAPHLILAGDIGDPASSTFESFMKQCSDSFEHVYFVPGNHEYHGHGISHGHALMQKVLGKFHNVSFLQCNKATIGPFVVLGATLWTHIPSSLHETAIKVVGDYTKMKKEFTPAMCNALNRQHVTWLSNSIREAQSLGQKVIVVTHHPPSMQGTSLTMYKADPLRFCYRNNLDHLISLPGNIAWICGHTHFSYTQQRGRTFMIANQFNSKQYKKNNVYKINLSENPSCNLRDDLMI